MLWIKAGYKMKLVEQSDSSYTIGGKGVSTNTYEYTFSEDISGLEHNVTFVNTVKLVDFVFTKVKAENTTTGLNGADLSYLNASAWIIPMITVHWLMQREVSPA